MAKNHDLTDNVDLDNTDCDLDKLANETELDAKYARLYFCPKTNANFEYKEIFRKLEKVQKQRGDYVDLSRCDTTQNQSVAFNQFKDDVEQLNCAVIEK